MKTQRARSCFLLFIRILLLSLSACTPGPYHYNVVEKISIDKDIVYVRASQECNLCEDAGGPVYYASRDNGQTWDEITSPAEDVTRNLTGEPKGRSVQCLSPDLQTCYRIKKEEQVEISDDGGIVWQVDWQIPDGRKYYMQRLSPYPELDTVPYDLQILESNAGYYIIIAMGNQGVLVKSPDGNWDRFAVGLAAPTPYQSASLSEAMDVLDAELYLIIFIALGIFLLLSFCVWVTVCIYSDGVRRKKVAKPFFVLLFSLGFLLIYYYILFASPLSMRAFERLLPFYSVFLMIFTFAVRVAPIVAFISYMLTWIMVFNVSSKGISGLALLLNILIPVGLYFGFLFPFQLWAVGTIPVYETAQMYAWIAGIFFLLIAFLAEFLVAKFSVKQFNK